MSSSKRLSPLLLVLAVGACADSSLTAPEQAAFDEMALMEIVIDPLDLNTQTHTFDDLPENCVLDAPIPNPYEGLTFLGVPYFGVCVTPNGTMGLIPGDQSTYGNVTELLIDLPQPASAASIEVMDFFSDRDFTLNAYDADGVLVDAASDPTDGEWVTIAVSGDIHRLGFETDQANTYLDNLMITYAADGGGGDDGGDGGDGGDPADKDSCKKGGWEAFGFKNQGQCVSFVETGKDSR